MTEQVQLMAWKPFVGRLQTLFVPDQFETVAATASGNTTVWHSDNNFLLHGFSITVAGTLAAAGEQIVQIVDEDASVVIAEFSTFLGTTASGSAFFGQDYGGGYGYLSLPSDGTLAVNLGTAMATGHVTVNAWGNFNIFPSP